jgi:hypothetical protein
MMRFNHHFNGVRNVFPTGQRVAHAGVPLADPITERDSVKFSRNASGLTNSPLNVLGNFSQMYVTWNHFRKRIDDCHQWSPQVVGIKSGAVKQRAMRGTLDSIHKFSALVVAVMEIFFEHAVPPFRDNLILMLRKSTSNKKIYKENKFKLVFSSKQD